MPLGFDLTKLGLQAGIAALLLGVAWLHGHSTGKHNERERWYEREVVAQRAARQTEIDLAEIARKSAARIAEKERLLNEQARRRAKAWSELLASLPRVDLPRAVGLHLDRASGVSDAPTVAEPPGADPDGPALDAIIGLADTLDIVRENYLRCAANISRLTEARDWYNDLRDRVNQ